MKEEFLHFIWKYQKFEQSNLKSTQNQPLQVIHPGEINKDSGPDFFKSKIYIGDTLWIGNVEIHINSSDWFTHRHQDDLAYNNVILHVVFNHDRIILDQNGNEIPCLELNGIVQFQLLQNYQGMIGSKERIACVDQISSVDLFTKNNCIEFLAIERLERKVDEIQSMLKNAKGDWEEVTYKMLLRAFGQLVNKDPFIMLSQQLPYYIVRKVDDLTQLEALFFGISGFLNAPEDEYSQLLQKEFHFLKKKFQLEEMKLEQWKFMRMRPGNFPSVRLAQLVRMVHLNQRPLRRLIEEPSLKVVQKDFHIRENGYWNTHYNFGKQWRKNPVQMGSGFLNHLFINAFIPVLFAYGKSHDDIGLQEKSLAWLQLLPSENNSIVERYKSFGFKVGNAMQSQGVVQLFRDYCEPKKCLNCTIGYKLLNKV